jgi:acyl carrier protein
LAYNIGENVEERDIYTALTDVFRDTFDNDSIVLRPDVTPSDIPGWDSARYITLVVATEARFGIRFEPAELESLRTVSDYVERIEAKLARPVR